MHDSLLGAIWAVKLDTQGESCAKKIWLTLHCAEDQQTYIHFSAPFFSFPSLSLFLTLACFRWISEMATTSVSQMLYPWPWELAVWANQHRYPANERVPLLLGSEIILDELYLTQQEVDTYRGLLGKVQPVVAAAKPVYGPYLSSHLFPGDGAPERWSTSLLNFHPPNIAGIAATHPSLLLHDQSPVPIAGVRHIVRLCRLKPDVTPIVRRAFKLDEFIVRQDTWIDSVRREMVIIAQNESWKNTGLIGDVTLYRSLPEPGDWQTSKLKKAPAPKLLYHQDEMCLFMQYAFFQVKPNIKIPFRNAIESSVLKSYFNSTQQGRALDVEFMQKALDAGLWDEKEKKDGRHHNQQKIPTTETRQ